MVVTGNVCLHHKQHVALKVTVVEVLRVVLMLSVRHPVALILIVIVGLSVNPENVLA